MTHPSIAEKAYLPFTKEQALREASRCLMCHDAPCESSCPSHVPVKEFIRNIRFENFRAAYDLIVSANFLGTSCGRICNSSETCASICTSKKIGHAIEIQKLQQFVCDQFVGNFPPYNQTAQRKESVAIIGGGPAGLSAALELTQQGVNVTLYERDLHLGGVPFKAIPNYRIPQDMTKKELNFFNNHPGLTLKLGQSISDLTDIKNSHDAVIVATGYGQTIQSKIPGSHLNGVYSANEILIRHKQNSPLSLIGETIVIIGGGNAAVDAAHSVLEMGAEKAILIYRRGEAEMPAWKREIDIAKKMGVEFRFMCQPIEILGQTNVESLRLQLTQYSSQESKSTDQRKSVQPISGTEFILKTNAIVFGIGETFEESLFQKSNLHFQEENNTTSDPKVFCCGDLTSKKKSVVHSVEEGRRCAYEVLHSFGIKPQITPIKKSYYSYVGANLSTEFCGITFENPFILAAAPPTDNLEMIRDAFKKGWAGAVLKTTSIESNEVPLKYPMMTGIRHRDRNLMGLGNIDLISEHHIDVVEKRIQLLKKEFPNKIVIASIMGAEKDDWQTLVQRLEKAGVDMIECSFSCPQGTLGAKPGFMLGQDPKLVQTVAGWIKESAKRVPIVIKITPQVTDIVEIAKAVKASGADAICASNSIPSMMGIDIKNFIPFPNVNGKSTYSGFTGPAIKPITLRNIAEIRKHVNIPITGTGGPVSWKDAIELMSVGASNVQFCTAVMHYGFDIIDDLCSGLSYYLKEMGFTNTKDIVDRALPFLDTHDGLFQQQPVVSQINPSLCIGCGACYIACRDGGHRAIEFDSHTRIAKTNTALCVGCGFCPSACPISDCITMVNSQI